MSKEKINILSDKIEYIKNKFCIGEEVICFDGSAGTVAAIYKPLAGDEKIAYAVIINGKQAEVKAAGVFKNKKEFDQYIYDRDYKKYLELKTKFNNK